MPLASFGGFAANEEVLCKVELGLIKGVRIFSETRNLYEFLL